MRLAKAAAEEASGIKSRDRNAPHEGVSTPQRAVAGEVGSSSTVITPPPPLSPTRDGEIGSSDARGRSDSVISPPPPPSSVDDDEGVKGKDPWASFVDEMAH